jgi:hypothetical protein
MHNFQEKISIIICLTSAPDLLFVGDKPYKGTLTKRRREERILNIERELKSKDTHFINHKVTII